MGAPHRLAAILLSACALTASAQAQDSVFVETTEVVVVNVDVTVTDRQGRPILGLDADDFTVLEDGKPMEISNFAAVDERRGEGGTPAVTPEPAGATGSEERAGGTPLDLFVYVDNYNLVAKHRDLVLDSLVEHLDQTLRPRDRVTLIVHDGGHLAFPLRRSSSRAEIVAAVDAIREMPAGGIDDRLLQRDAVRGIKDVFELYDDGTDVCSEAEGVLLAVASGYAEAVSQHVRASLDGLETLLRVLSAVEGRKPILHVSDGFAAQPGLGMFSHLGDLCGGGRFVSQASAYDETARLAALAASANANRVTFFPLQASGLSGLSDFGSATAMAMRTNLQQPLEMMAEETGGRAILNTNDFEAPLRAVDGDSRVYYSIGYHPPERPEGAEGEDRRIEVRLAADDLPGTTLRFRRRYGLKTAEERLAERTLGALYGFEHNPLGIRLAIGGPAEASPPRLVLTIAVPREQLTYLRQGSHWECQVDLVIGHVGETGGETRQRRIKLTAEGKGDHPPEGVETLQVAVGARPGSNRVAVGVADVVSSRIATVAGNVEMPAVDSTRPAGRSPRGVR